jgi:hypothetical protein
MRFLILVFMLMGGVASADVIRWGEGGSIFGGASWTITPDDHVVYAAFVIDGGFSQRPEWVWTNKAALQGQITFVMPGAFATASDIVQGAGNPGAAPAFATDCTDVGQFSMEVQIAGLTYAATADNCIPTSPDASVGAKRHYAAMRALEAKLVAGLGLDGVMGQ